MTIIAIAPWPLRVLLPKENSVSIIMPPVPQKRDFPLKGD
jgi:hypothetical protein